MMQHHKIVKGFDTVEINLVTSFENLQRTALDNKGLYNAQGFCMKACR